MREPCDRLPCDWAYRGQAHADDERGHVLHAVSVASGEVDGQGWRVDMVAVDGSTWTVRLAVPGLVVDGEADELHELGQAVTRAGMRAARFNLTDAWQVMACDDGEGVGGDA